MSRFDGGQLAILVDRFWNLEELSCPYDGTKIWTQLYGQTAGYLLVLGCPRCGIKAQVTPYSDPMRAAFRMWTESEGCALAHDHACGRCVCCPVCRARIKCGAQGKPVRLLECPRCGNQHMAMAIQEASAMPRGQVNIAIQGEGEYC